LDQLQKELEADFPALDIQLIGVNKVGKEAGNEVASEGRDIPLLQDVDAEDDGNSDAWSLWDVQWRDVVIVDAHNTKVGTYNLTTYDLAESENYASLREMLVDAAMQSQKPWQNPDDELDVDDSGSVSPLDVLVIVNELNSAGSHGLAPPTAASSPPPYYDCNGDGAVTPLDVLQVVNFLNARWRQTAGEGESLPFPQHLSASKLESTATAQASVAVSGALGETQSRDRTYGLYITPSRNGDAEQSRIVSQPAQIDRAFTSKPTDWLIQIDIANELGPNDLASERDWMGIVFEI